MHTINQLNSALTGRYTVTRELGAGGMATVYLAPDVGKALGVGAIVEGTVRRAGDRIRLTAQLTRTRDGQVLWRERRGCRFGRDPHWGGRRARMGSARPGVRDPSELQRSR